MLKKLLLITFLVLMNKAVFTETIYVSNEKDHNITVLPKQIQVENHKALPDLLETFKDLFIDNVTGEMKQENLFYQENYF